MSCTGVFECTPRSAEGATWRETLYMGETHLSESPQRPPARLLFRTPSKGSCLILLLLIPLPPLLLLRARSWRAACLSSCLRVRSNLPCRAPGPEEVSQFVFSLAQTYPGNSYRLLQRNCNHFSDELCKRLVHCPAPRCATAEHSPQGSCSAVRG